MNVRTVMLSTQPCTHWTHTPSTLEPARTWALYREIIAPHWLPSGNIACTARKRPAPCASDARRAAWTTGPIPPTGSQTRKKRKKKLDVEFIYMDGHYELKLKAYKYIWNITLLYIGYLPGFKNRSQHHPGNQQPYDRSAACQRHDEFIIRSAVKSTEL